MGEPLIPGGYILLSRKLIDSEIWNKPPLYLKVWIYLLSLAQHRQYKQLARGQLFTSIPEIQEACSWYVGFRKYKPSKDQIFNVLEWLRKPYESNDVSNGESNGSTTMITTMKATQGMLISIVNYNVYQDSKNYESNDVSNDVTDTKATTYTLREQRQANNINKNDKNDKNVKNEEDTSIAEVEQVPYERIINLYNSICISFNPIQNLTKVRKGNINARYRESKCNIEVFKIAFTKMQNSDFIKSGWSTGGKADFDWVMRPTNFVKVLEGKYDNKNQNKQYNTSNPFLQMMQDEIKQEGIFDNDEE